MDYEIREELILRKSALYDLEPHDVGVYHNNKLVMSYSYEDCHNAVKRAEWYVKNQQRPLAKTTYGLYPFLWRALRKKVWGGEIPLYDKHLNYLGEGTVFRYEPHISIDVDFKSICWYVTLNFCPESRCGALTPDVIQVDINYC